MNFSPGLLTFRFFAHNVDVACPRMPSLRGALRASCSLLQFPVSRFVYLWRFIAILLAIHCLHDFEQVLRAVICSLSFAPWRSSPYTFVRGRVP